VAAGAAPPASAVQRIVAAFRRATSTSRAFAFPGRFFNFCFFAFLPFGKKSCKPLRAIFFEFTYISCVNLNNCLFID